MRDDQKKWVSPGETPRGKGGYVRLQKGGEKGARKRGESQLQASPRKRLRALYELGRTQKKGRIGGSVGSFLTGTLPKKRPNSSKKGALRFKRKKGFLCPKNTSATRDCRRLRKKSEN